jgi:hypothetical protein
MLDSIILYVWRQVPSRQGQDFSGTPKSPGIEFGNLYTHFWHLSSRKIRVQLQATLCDASERSPRANDGAEGAEIVLARWWSWLILWVKDMQAFWQTRSSLS